jgi:hypothetical protein
VLSYNQWQNPGAEFADQVRLENIQQVLTTCTLGEIRLERELYIKQIVELNVSDYSGCAGDWGAYE